MHLEVQDHLPNEAQPNARIPVSQINHIVVDQFQSSGPQTFQRCAQVVQLVHPFYCATPASAQNSTENWAIKLEPICACPIACAGRGDWQNITGQNLQQVAKQNAVAHVHEKIIDLSRGGMLQGKAHLAMGMLRLRGH